MRIDFYNLNIIKMAKLIFITKPPKKRCIKYSSKASHVLRHLEKPPIFQEEGLSLIVRQMQELTDKLEKIGYDQTTVKFSIETKLPI